MNVEAGYKHKCPESCPLDLYRILLSCLETIPEDRPNFTTLVAALTGLRSGLPAAPLQNNGNGAPRVQSSPAVATSGYLDGLQEIPTSTNTTPDPAPVPAPAPGLLNRLHSDAAYVATDANRIDKMIAALSETPVLSLREAVATAEPHCKRSFETEVAFATRFAEVYVESESGKKHAAGMTVTDVAAIHFYSQETVFYSKMNGVMGGYGPDGTAPLPQYLPYIRLLTIAMGKLEQISAVGYRAIRNVSINTLLEGKGIGGRIVWPAFTSCTLDPDVLRDPAFLGIGSSAGHGERIVCKLHISTAVQIEHFSEMGSSADYYLKPGIIIAGGDFEQNEKEMLLFPGTTLEIIAITPFDGVTEIELREVPTTRAFPDHLVQSAELVPAPLEAASGPTPTSTANSKAINSLCALLAPHRAAEPVKTCMKTETYNPRDNILQLTRDNHHALQAAIDKVTSELQTLDTSAVDDASRRINEDLGRSIRARNANTNGDDPLVPLQTRLSGAAQLLDHYAHRILSECTLPLSDADAVLESLQAIVVDPVVLLVKEEIVAMCKDVCKRPKAYKKEVKKLGDDDKIIYERTFNKMVRHSKDRQAHDDMIDAVNLLKTKFEGTTSSTNPVQRTANILALTLKVRETRPRFEDLVLEAVANIAGVETPQFRAKTKALYRMIEKGILKGPNSASGAGWLVGFTAADLDCSQVLDVFGCLIVCEDFVVMKTAILQIGNALAPSRGSGNICRIKNRWREETGGGWKDLMINVEIDGVIFEMQLVHKKLYTARKSMDGHKAYAEYRCYLELLAFAGQLDVQHDGGGGDGGASYDVVFSHTHEQLPFVQELVQELVKRGFKCFTESNLDKINPNRWPFEWRSAYKAARLCVCVLTREYLREKARCIEWAVASKGDTKRTVIAADSSANSITTGVQLTEENVDIVNHLDAGYDVAAQSRSTVSELCAIIQRKLQHNADGPVVGPTVASDRHLEQPLPLAVQPGPSVSVLTAAPIDVLVVVDFPSTADGAALEPAKYIAPFRKLKEALEEKFKGKQVRIRFHTPRSLVKDDKGLLSTRIPCVCWIAMGEEAAPDPESVFTSSLWKTLGGKCGLAIVFMKHGAEWVSGQLHAHRCANRIAWIAEDYSEKAGAVLLTKKVPEVLLKVLTGAKFESDACMRKVCKPISDFIENQSNIAFGLLYAEDLEMMTPAVDGDRLLDDDDDVVGISLHRVPSNPPNLSNKIFGLRNNISVDLNQWPSSRQLQEQLSKRQDKGWRLIAVTGATYEERKMVVWDAVQSFQEPRGSGSKRFELIAFRDVTGKDDGDDWELPFESESSTRVLIWLDSRTDLSVEALGDLFEEPGDDHLLPWTVIVTASTAFEDDSEATCDVTDDNCTVLPNVVVPLACGTTVNDSCADLIQIIPVDHVTDSTSVAESSSRIFDSPLASYHIYPADIVIGSESLGRGHFGAVSEGYLGVSKSPVAVKTCKDATADKHPYSDMNNSTVRERVVKGYRMDAPAGTPACMDALMKKCWQHDEQNRPTMADVVDYLAECKDAYPTLTEAYPSTVGMFATTLVCEKLNDQPPVRLEPAPGAAPLAAQMAYPTLTAAYPSTVGMFAAAVVCKGLDDHPPVRPTPAQPLYINAASDPSGGLLCDEARIAPEAARPPALIRFKDQPPVRPLGDVDDNHSDNTAYGRVPEIPYEAAKPAEEISRKSAPMLGGGVNLADMADLSQDDRMAVMRMVAEGELSVDEAIKSVKTQAVAKVELKRGNGPNRRGGVKRAFRGRVRIEVMVIGPDKPISIMVVKVASCRDLEPVNANSFTTLQVLPDLENPASPTINQTAIQRNSKHPTFDEQFTWEVRRKDIDLDHTRLHITVKDRKQGTIGHKDVFLGSMSFALAEVFEPENPGPNGAVSGWFKLLDEKKGYFQHQVFVPKLRVRVPASQAAAAPAEGGGRTCQPPPTHPVKPPGGTAVPAPHETVLESSGSMEGDDLTKKHLKVVIVGDGACGKTSLLVSFSEKRFPAEYVPTVFENYVADIDHNGGTVELALWDTAGLEDYVRIRPLSYPDADIVIICYSIVDPDSFENVPKKWVPEVQHFCPGVPYILVGCKSDARTERLFLKNLASMGQKPVPARDAQNMANEIGALDCIECSAKESIGFKYDSNFEILAGATPLLVALEVGNTSIVQLLLEYNANGNVALASGITPLILAAGIEADYAVRTLLERNADPNTPFAIVEGFEYDYDFDILGLRFKYDSDFDILAGATPLLEALQVGNTSIVQLLLEYNANGNVALASGVTPLMLALDNNDGDVVKLLLDHNANPSMLNCDGCTPMQIAACKGYVNVANILLQAKRNQAAMFDCLAHDIASHAVAKAVDETVLESSGSMKGDDLTKKRLKVVIVGDGACGKTSLLISFSEKRFPTESVPTVFENYVADIDHNGGSVELALWDTSGAEDYDRMRPLSYPDADIVIICYSIVEPDTFENVPEKWVPEVRHFCPGVPYILVGCKSDARTERLSLKDLASKGQKPVPARDSQNMAAKIGALDYIECSAKESIGVHNVFHRAVSAASMENRAAFEWTRVFLGINVACYTPSTTSTLALLVINACSKFVDVREFNAAQTFLRALLVAASQESNGINKHESAEQLLAVAMLVGNQEITKLAMLANVKPDMSILLHQGEQIPILIAVKNEQNGILKFLLENDVDPNMLKTGDDQSLVFISAQRGNGEAVTSHVASL
eukprot:gene8444-8919_t